MPDPLQQQSPFLPQNQPPTVAPAPTLGALAQPQPNMPQPGPVPQTPQDLQTKAASWDSYFANPAVASALLQFGVNMLQPRPVGQTMAGAIGASVGAAGEAAGRTIQQGLATDLALSKEQQAQQRVGLESRRVATGETQAATDAQRVANEAAWRKQWNDIQQQHVDVSRMQAGLAQATNEVARERLQREIDQGNQKLELERQKLAQDWLLKNADRADRADANLLAKMYDAAMRQPRLPDEPPPDIGKIGQDFLTLRDTLKSVKGGDDVFKLGTEQQWRQMLGDPKLKQQAIDTFGADVVTRAEKKLQDISKGTKAP